MEPSTPTAPKFVSFDAIGFGDESVTFGGDADGRVQSWADLILRCYESIALNHSALTECSSSRVSALHLRIESVY